LTEPDVLSTPASIIGKGERRVDALGKTTGRAKFAADSSAIGHWVRRLRRTLPT